MRLAIVFAVIAALALPGAASASTRFADARGDAGDGPDIVGVALSHTDSALRIAVDFASSPPLRFDEQAGYTDMLLVAIHTDDNFAANDVEFWTGAHAVDLTRGPLVRGSGPSRQAGTTDVSVAGKTVTLELDRALIDDPGKIAIQVAAGRESTDPTGGDGGDFAPAAGVYPYDFGGNGSPWWVWPLVGIGAGGVALTAALLVRHARRSGHRGRLGVAS
jgi:hypothetical protein